MTDDFTAIARRMVDRHTPQGVGGLDVFEYADLAAFLEWDVDATVPTMAKDYGITEDAARELLLGARSERLGVELADDDEEVSPS